MGELISSTFRVYFLKIPDRQGGPELYKVNVIGRNVRSYSGILKLKLQMQPGQGEMGDRAESRGQDLFAPK